MTRTLILLRHGRTAWNAQGRAQGHADVPLDDVGHAQALSVAPAVAAMQPTVLWSSDLARARETASYIASACSLDIVLDPRLREFDMGERTGMSMPEFSEVFPEGYAAFRAGSYDGVPGSETSAQVVERSCTALREAFASLVPGQCGVVVGHGAAIKVSLIAMLDWPAELSGALQGLDNCGWATLDDSGATGELRLTAYNRTAPPHHGGDFTSAGSVG